jgi:hypothetical protein
LAIVEDLVTVEDEAVAEVVAEVDPEVAGALREEGVVVALVRSRGSGEARESLL